MSEKREAVNKINLTKVREKFLKRKGWWWRLRNGYSIYKIEQDYRDFLYLILENPEKTIVPWTQDLDDFWHEHILDTGKYRQDCLDLFGRFIDHNPHLPQGTPEHTAAVKDTYESRREILPEYFPMPDYSSSASCGLSHHETPSVSCSTSHPSDLPSCGAPSCSSDSSSCGGSSCGSSCGSGGE